MDIRAVHRQHVDRVRWDQCTIDAVFRHQPSTIRDVEQELQVHSVDEYRRQQNFVDLIHRDQHDRLQEIRDANPNRTNVCNELRMWHICLFNSQLPALHVDCQRTWIDQSFAYDCFLIFTIQTNHANLVLTRICIVNIARWPFDSNSFGWFE